MANDYDAIVIGGGHNGLIHAAYLGRSGWRVLVLERREHLGGAAVTEEVVPGFKFSVASYAVSLLRPEIIRELSLERHGLEILPLSGTFSPLENGDYLWRGDDPGETYNEIARHSRRDATRYPEYGESMARMARFVKPFLAMTPPDPTTLRARDIKDSISIVRHVMALAPRDRETLFRLTTMSALDFLDDWFEADPLKATLAASGVIGTFLGVRSRGTAYVLLHHYMGEIDGVYRNWGIPRGGTGAVSEAIASAARSFGVETRTEAAVESVTVRNQRASGVVLSDGSELRARVISSSIDPRQTFTRLVTPDELPDDFNRAIERFRFRGCSAKLNLALDALPDFSSRPGPGAHLKGAISISPSTEYMERAFDEAKYGRFSRRPYIDIVIPSLTDSTLAPPGKHVMSCFVQYAPYDLKEGSWDDCRDALAGTIIETLAEHAPNLPDIILERQLLTPLDLERTFGLSEGNIFHGELTPEQLFSLRPARGWAQYGSPIRNLYICGSGAHPGGGIMGAPGRNAALHVLNDHA